MNKLTEIIEYRPKSQREDFLEYLLERGIDLDEQDEIVSIILSYFPRHNDWTLVLLIDLTFDEDIISEELLNIYLSGLLDNKTFYIKLSILDYIDETKSLYKKAKINIDFTLIEKLAYDKKNKIVVRNEALHILMKVYPSRKNELLLQIKQNLKNTNDYSAHIRFYNGILVNDFYKEIPLKEILNIIEISKKRNFGRAVDDIVTNLELRLHEL